MTSAIGTRIQNQRDTQGAEGIRALVTRTSPVAIQEQPLNRNDPRNSNASGAASMPQVMNGFSVNTAGVMALPANPARGYLMVQNNSNANLLVSYDSIPSAFASYIVGPGGYFEPRVVPTNSVYVASATLTNAACIVIEGNK
jgi:hypothetical protein